MRAAIGHGVRAALDAIGVLAALAPADAACLTAHADDQVAEGKLLHRLFIDFAHRKGWAYVLDLARPACLHGEQETDQVESSKRIHVYSMDAEVRRKMRGLVGKTVRVTGSPFGEHTIYHHAPIVMHVGAIERR